MISLFKLLQKKEELINSADIENYIMTTFKNVQRLNAWGETSFFINPNQQLKRGTYFATLKEKDGENDKSSHLNRDNIFRLNIGTSKETYLSLFQSIPKRPGKGQTIEGNYDFEALNTIMPHPVYGWMGWVCVLNPTNAKFETCKELLTCAYNKATHLTNKKLLKVK